MMEINLKVTPVNHSKSLTHYRTPCVCCCCLKKGIKSSVLRTNELMKLPFFLYHNEKCHYTVKRSLQILLVIFNSDWRFYSEDITCYIQQLKNYLPTARRIVSLENSF